jgi:hypothetical protein
MAMDHKVTDYRLEEPVLSILKSIKNIKVDESILEELKTYRVFSSSAKIKFIHGPEDFDTLFDVFETVQVQKDRVCEIQLKYMELKSNIDHLYNIVKNHLWLKPEIIELKNDGQRNIIVSKVIPEIEERQHKINLIIASAELINKNLNSTYNIAKEQSITVQQKMYHRNLTETDK